MTGEHFTRSAGDPMQATTRALNNVNQERAMNDVSVPTGSAPDEPTEWHGQFLIVNGRRLYCVDHGQGRPLVFVHGWGMDHTSWSAVTRRLAPDHRIIAVDLRGHGRSDPSTEAFPFSDLASVLVAVLKRLDLDEPPILVGHSMGGMVVQQCVVDHPELAAGVVIVDSDLNAGLLRAAMTVSGYVGAAVLRWASMLLGEARALSFYPAMMDLIAYSPSWRREHLDQLRANAKQFARINNTSGLAWSFQAYATRPDLSQSLHEVAPRALLVRGSKDLIMFQSKMEALQRAIPRSELVVIPGSGHMTVTERPERVAELIEAFVIAEPIQSAR